ncbi:hypothetical protein JCM17478_23690 [Thermopirellula anaerolimosa]
MVRTPASNPRRIDAKPLVCRSVPPFLAASPSVPTVRDSAPRGLFAFLCLLCLAESVFLSWGCRRAVVSPQAAPWPALARDPLETGRDLDRWPGFRGLSAQGVAPGGAPPARFGPDAGLRWKAEVPGEGNSSPVVWGDRLFLTWQSGDRRSPELYLGAWDRRTGRVLWQRKATTAQGRTHPKNGYASATPATDGKRIFVFFGSAGFFCYDLDGTLLWRRDLGPQEHIYGVASSPVLFGDWVIQLCDRERDSFLVALRKTDGEEAWRTPRQSTGGWTTPLIVRTTAAGGRDELLVNGGQVDNTAYLTSYDPRTGKEWWRIDGLETLVTPTALAAGETAFSMSGRNGPIFAVPLGRDGRLTEADLLWKLPRGGPYIPSGLIYRNRLYVLSDLKRLTCYDPGTGRTIWSGNLSGTFTASLTAANGRIYAANEQGTVFVIPAGDRWETPVENRLGDGCLATPAFADGDLIVRTRRFLFCFAGEVAAEEGKSPETGERPARDSATPSPTAGSTMPTGVTNESGRPKDKPSPDPASAADASSLPPPEVAPADAWPLFRGTPACSGIAVGDAERSPRIEWVYSAEKESFTASPVVAGGTVYLGGNNGTFYAVDVGTGRVRWKHEIGGGFLASAALHAGRVYVGDVDGKFFAWNAEDGKQLWQFEAGGTIDNAANVFSADGRTRVLFGSQDMNLYCLDGETGAVVWRAALPDQIRCQPPVVGDLAFVAGCDGKLHAIELETGKERIACDLDGPTGCTPAVRGAELYVGTESGFFFGIDWQAGRRLWQFPPENPADAFRSSAAVCGPYVVVGCRDRQIYCFNTTAGDTVWKFTTKRYVDASPVIVRPQDGDLARAVVVVGSLDGRLHGLGLQDGSAKWELDLGGAVSASAAVVGERIFAATEEGDLYCLMPSRSASP